MAFFIQYDAGGFILATVAGAAEPPVVDNVTRWQLELPEWASTEGKMVDTTTRQLVDAPPTE
ncbi:hypothetical protein [Limnoglobus roseus]|uniref:Uncharacterized protein n=1 Tax=Limnoglobus roseus TaxID=2598579 RepID=A0A5C1AH00_9BACT|nr:hypothetical protein [Limnoglobus roseus]QEL18699.1 hypothetical protein PX52LOC_05735 [Limnoglobus roseus]